MDTYQYTDELAHFGILGQKWGIRNYQYEDGTLTPEGKVRYRSSNGNGKKAARIAQRDLNSLDKKRRVLQRKRDDQLYWRKNKEKAAEYDRQITKIDKTTNSILEQTYKNDLMVLGSTTMRNGYNFGGQMLTMGGRPILGQRYDVFANDDQNRFDIIRGKRMVESIKWGTGYNVWYPGNGKTKKWR